MHIGHINLSESFIDAGKNFVTLIESLQQHSMQQHVLVRNVALAKRISLIENVTVGPVVRSPVSAYSLMPHVDVVHIHDLASRSAGILLALTRSVPFVLTRHQALVNRGNPLDQAACKRASGFVEESQTGIGEHLRVYRRAVDSQTVPTMLL